MKVKPRRALGIDFGIARLGLAISDERKIIASPFMTFQTASSTKLTIQNLMKTLDEMQEANSYEIDEIIVGLPLMMSGKVGMIADEVKHFVALLKEATSIPIIMWDERLTTVQAERSLRLSDMTRKKRSKVVDKVCAAIILQCYLDSKTLPSIF